MAGFKVVEGRKSSLYNLFKEYEFVTCRATDTRLMGVVAMKIAWRMPDKPGCRLYQIIHLDYSEYGVDEYLEFECIQGSEDYTQNKEDVKYYWNHFLRVMGAKAVTITAEEMLKLIDSATALAGEETAREYDNDELRSFRAYALRRIGLMSEALAERGINSGNCSGFDAIHAVAASNLGTYATINYFIMRLADMDYEAAEYLSEMDAEDFDRLPFAKYGIQTLMRNTITKVARKDDPKEDRSLRMFNCKVTTLAKHSYYHSSVNIWLDGGRMSRDVSVIDVSVGDIVRLSDYEAAMLVKEHEYITLLDCNDKLLHDFDVKYISALADAETSAVPNGWLFTAYNRDNSHVEKSEYRLGDDVLGYALLTIGGELILMSHSLRNITVLDESALFSAYSPLMTLKGRYRLDNPIFQTLCQQSGLYFDHLIEPDDD